VLVAMGVHAAPGGYFTVSWTGRLYSCGQALGLWQYPCNDKSPSPFTSPDPCPGPAPDLECEVADNTKKRSQSLVLSRRP